MSKVKMNFDTKIAKQLGTDTAIIFSNIEFWVETSKANKINFHDGKYWYYNSINAFCELFDWLTRSQIKTCLEKLEKNGFIISGNFNQMGYDRTKWYSIPLNSTIGDFSTMECADFDNGLAKISQPIPDYKPNNKQEFNKEEIDFDKLREYYNYVFSKETKIVNDKAKRQFNKLVKIGYNKDDIKKVIDNASNDSFHAENNFKHVTLEFLSREEKFEKYVSMPHEVPRVKKLKGHTNH